MRKPIKPIQPQCHYIGCSGNYPIAELKPKDYKAIDLFVERLIHNMEAFKIFTVHALIGKTVTDTKRHDLIAKLYEKSLRSHIAEQDLKILEFKTTSSYTGWWPCRTYHYTFYVQIKQRKPDITNVETEF